MQIILPKYLCTWLLCESLDVTIIIQIYYWISA